LKGTLDDQGGNVDLAWGHQFALVKIILLSQLVLVLVSAVRFINSAGPLYRYPGAPISAEDLLRTGMSPDVVASSAFANRLKYLAVLQKCEKRTNAEDLLQVLRVADTKFQYLWEGCYADVSSARRFSLLSFMLTVVMIGYITFPTLSSYQFDKSACAICATEHLLLLFALGCSCCALLYFASSFFERALALRKIRWNYFRSILMQNLSRS
jgi:hypothetical protein